MTRNQVSHWVGESGGWPAYRSRSPQRGHRPRWARTARSVEGASGGGWRRGRCPRAGPCWGGAGASGGGGCQRRGRAPVALPAVGPVRGEGRVIGGCAARDRGVPDDRGPGVLVEVGAGFPVAEDPRVVPGLVVAAEVVVCDPSSGFPAVLAERP